MVHGLVDVFHGERGSHSERGSRQLKLAAHAELSTWLHLADKNSTGGMVHGLVDVFHGERGSHSERGSRQFKLAAHAELSTPRQCIERVAYELEAEVNPYK